ncbi:MAG: ABC transporter substrate-binding protein [Alphaproteobacteria bacterium]|nr:ABC transporter substrate-binding protein [Alphaproteobacteria bacterium]
MHSTLKRLAVLGLAATVAVAGVSGAAAQTKPAIKVGAILPMTGPIGTVGKMIVAAIELAVEDINTGGGINGSKIELMVEDDQANPTQSVLMARRNAQNNAVIVLGPVTGTSWENVAPTSTALKLPTINFNSLKPQVANSEWAMRIHPNDSMMIPESMKQFIKLHPNVKRIVVMADMKEASAEAGAQEIIKFARANGLTVVDTIDFQTATTDFSPLVIKARGQQPDAVFSTGLLPTVLKLSKEMQTQGLDVPHFNNSMVWPGATPNVIGPAGKNFFSAGFTTNEQIAGNERFNRFLARYEERVKNDTAIPKPANVGNGTLQYDTVHMVAKMMRDKGIDGNTPITRARELMRDAMKELQGFDGLVQLKIGADRNGYVRSHLVRVDPDAKIWRYALPADQRM